MSSSQHLFIDVDLKDVKLQVKHLPKSELEFQRILIQVLHGPVSEEQMFLSLDHDAAMHIYQRLGQILRDWVPEPEELLGQKKGGVA